MEKIKQIEISNFKSIKHLKIDGCNTINIFVGMPNAGKSNILEAMGLFGGLGDFVFDNKLKNYVRYNNEHELFFEGITDNIITICINESTNLKIANKNNFIKDLEHLEVIDSDLKLYSEIVDEKNYLSDNFFTTDIKKYTFDNTKTQKKGRRSLDFPFGENIGQVLSENPKLRETVLEYLSSSGLKMVIKSGTFELVLQKDLEDGTVFELPYSMIADTLQRLIFYKAVIMSNENTVLLFEEPEAHCFEPYILEFTNAIKYDKNDNQYFIVTHSDYILKEFLRDEDSKEKTNIYLVNNVDGETQVKLLDKSKNDDVFEYGMNVFFNIESLWENN